MKILYTGFLITMLLLTGCGGSDTGATPITNGNTSPIETSVQEVINCSDVVQSGTVEIRFNTFSPGSETITRGQIVKFENFDSQSHTVTSGGPNTPENKFDITLPPISEQNSEKCLKFTAPGSYPYFDKLHPLMTGVIVVQ